MIRNCPLAVVVLAHNDFPTVDRLISALGQIPVFLHVDRKAGAPFTDGLAASAHAAVRQLPRTDARLASWSLVAVELAGLRHALAETTAQHIAILSGSDFPLLAPEALIAELQPWAGRSWVLNRPLPHDGWSVPGFRDGGLWRMQLPFLTRRDQIVWVFGKPAFLPRRRTIPAELAPRASSHWKIYARSDAERVLQLLEQHPELVRFGRHTFTPEESFLQSLMAGPLFGPDALPPTSADAWYISWPDGPSQHPQWLSTADLAELRTRRGWPAATPDAVYGGHLEEPARVRPLFTRKVSVSRDPELVAELEADLRR